MFRSLQEALEHIDRNQDGNLDEIPVLISDGAYGARLAKLDEACPNNPDPKGHG